MNKSIRILSDSLINKIKAGEVIESPVSVVKELVENSIDASASTIHISICYGGLEEILVSDNGHGMSETDAFVCMQRHATSKLTIFSDLESLQTMGFRGEALAAVSSISKLEIITKRLSDLHATRMYSEGSKILTSGSAARESGTSICVRDLFYNVPARKSFQKSPNSLTRAISSQLRTIALAYPYIHFAFYAEGKEIWEINVRSDLGVDAMHLHRIKDVLHTTMIDDGFILNRVSGFYTIYGVTSTPKITRMNKKEQYLIVNRRVVFCEDIAKVLTDIYSTLIPANRFPCFVIYLTLPPSYIDVNVHPQKRFIKLKVQERAEIQKFVKETFIEVLYGNSVWSPVELDSGVQVAPAPIFSLNVSTSSTLCESSVMENSPTQLVFSIRDRIIGLFHHYLFLKSGLNLLLVDLHEAQEFLFLVRITTAIAKGVSIENQYLLLPIQLEWFQNETEWLKSHQIYLQNLGFIFELISPNISKIIAIPQYINENHTKDCLLSMMNHATVSSNISDTLAKRLVPFTKKKSIFTVLDAETLYDEVERVSSCYPGLLGFPIYSEFSYESITQLFRSNSTNTKPIEK